MKGNKRAQGGGGGRFNFQNATRNAARLRVQQQQVPINTAPTDPKGDNAAYAVFLLLLFAAAGVLGGGIYWSISGIVHATSVSPINWGACFVGAVTILLSVLVARALAWLSLFASVIVGTRMNGWKSVETICQKGLPITRAAKIFPGGSVWLATALMQSQFQRGQYDPALATAEGEWKVSGSIASQAQNLGTLCFHAGMADQAKGDMKQALVWNERAITVLAKTVEQIESPKKGFMAKFASVQYEKVLGQLKMQLAAAYFNNATMYFNNMDHRRAKENYKNAVESAAKAPDFPEKADIIKFGNEQLGRLKHS